MLATTSCAALLKESRMQSTNATDLDRKSGGAQWRDLCVDTFLECFSTEESRRPTQGDEKRLLFSHYCPWKHRPPLCHLDRSAAEWRDLRFSGPYLEIFFDRAKPSGGPAVTHTRSIACGIRASSASVEASGTEQPGVMMYLLPACSRADFHCCRISSVVSRSKSTSSTPPAIACE
jgi:hypothetical protein